MEEMLILTREDLKNNTLSIEDIEHWCFVDRKPLLNAEFSIFQDDDGSVKVLKNKFGDRFDGKVFKNINELKSSEKYILQLSQINKLKEINKIYENAGLLDIPIMYKSFDVSVNED